MNVQIVAIGGMVMSIITDGRIVTVNKTRFFNPFVGNKYKEGINGKRILVVGASFYCNRVDCQFFTRCTDVGLKNSSPYDNCCPVYQKAGKQLHYEPSYCISESPQTYKNFASYISKSCGYTSYEDSWNHLAFTNYVQFFLPSNGEFFRETRKADLSERDFNAFNETLVELLPDIVIIWGRVVNSILREKNECLVSKTEMDETEGYVCRIKVPEITHEISLIKTCHPSSSAWFSMMDTFDKYLSLELMR